MVRDVAFMRIAAAWWWFEKRKELLTNQPHVRVLIWSQTLHTSPAPDISADVPRSPLTPLCCAPLLVRVSLLPSSFNLSLPLCRSSPFEVSLRCDSRGYHLVSS